MTFEECAQFIGSIEKSAIGLQSRGRSIEKIIPLPVNITDGDLTEWIYGYWSYNILHSPRLIHELKESYQEYQPAYLFLLSADDPSSVRPEWLELDFPQLLNKERGE